MKIGSALLGILGGLVALVIGVISFFIGDIGQTLGIEGSVPRQVLSLALPVAALVGGGITTRSGLAGGILMLVSAVGILIVLEISVFSLITAIPIGIGGILALVSMAGSEKSPG
jgi:hypothetical protein